jgi:type IV secretory pathway VirJ component
MKKYCARWLMPLSLLSMAQAGPAPAFVESRLTLPRYGEVAIYKPVGEFNSVMIFLSGDGGWHLGVVDMARSFAAEGALVAGIDVRRYLGSLKPADAAVGNPACTNVGGDFESLSQTLQRRLQLPEYRHPILTGYSSGATIVYAALSQAPRGTFSGAISLGFCPDQDFAGAHLCRVNGTDYTLPNSPKPKDHSLILKANPRIQDRWIAVQGDRDQVCSALVTRDFTAAVPAAELVSLPKVGHGFSISANWWPAVRQSYGTLVARAKPVALAAPVADLPIYENARAADAPRSPRIAILLTGDGGWAGLDRDLADELAARGIPTAALSSIRYFWKERTPEQSATDVARMIRHYLGQWQGERVLLLGYSFGADVVPFIYNRLPAELRARVDVIGIMGLSPRATFEFKLSEWLPGGGDNGLGTVAEIQRTGTVPKLCVMGEGEKDSACPEAQSPSLRVITVGSGHHFSGKADEIVKQLLATAGD